MTGENTTPTTGTVEWFDDERGVGLVACDDGAVKVPETIAHLHDWAVQLSGDTRTPRGATTHPELADVSAS